MQPVPSALRPVLPARNRFSLVGRSVRIDSRITAVRRDIADIRLAERIFAPHYAVPLAKTCVEHTSLRATAANDAEILSELLPGERFDVLEYNGGLAWGMGCADGVVGFVPDSALGPYHADEPPANIPDYVAASEQLIGTPALPGGRSEAGVNCSGLLFLVLTRSGIKSPRFCDLQRTLGKELDPEMTLQRGDLIFYDDHAAIMRSDAEAVHVTDAVRIDDLPAIQDRFGPIVSRRRLMA